MSILMHNLHTLWSLIISLYNPYAIGFFSFLFGGLLIVAIFGLAEEEELSRNSILRFWLWMTLPMALNSSLWFFYQFTKLELLVNVSVSLFLIIPSLMVTSFHCKRSSEVGDDKQ